MKFEVGKEYGTITVEKRTPCYVTVSGAVNGRKLVREWFNGGEFIMVPVGRKCDMICCSWGGGIK